MGTRPRWRDALVLAVLAAVIIGGVVHYGRGLGHDEPGDRPSHWSPTSAPARHRAAEATAELDSAPPTDPGAPPAHDRRHLLGRPCDLLAPALRTARRGARAGVGLPVVRRATGGSATRPGPNADSYPVVESYECFQRALGQPVTVTYDQVKDPAQVERWLLARLGQDHRTEIPGAHGGRCIFTDGVTRPARITGDVRAVPLRRVGLRRQPSGR